MKPLGSQIIAEFIDCSVNVLNDRRTLERVLARSIEACGLTLVNTTAHEFEPVGVTVVAVIGESHVVIHTYPEARHASIDIFTCSDGSKAKKNLIELLKCELCPATVRLLDVSRGNPLEVSDKDWITCLSFNGYDTRYHIDRHIYSARSRYQQIDIIENDNFGKMLFLDKDLQIAERDAADYSRRLVEPLVESGCSLERVAILGGGDGAVLHELLRHGPGMVTLVEIDYEVIEAARNHLRGVCHDAFDRDNVRVIVEDPAVFLETARDLDAVICDLTMHPEALTRSDRQAFLDRILVRTRRCLSERGMMTVQCCSEFDESTRILLEELLMRHLPYFQFESAFIPSFCETWLFGRASVMAAVGPERRRLPVRTTPQL